MKHTLNSIFIISTLFLASSGCNTSKRNVYSATAFYKSENPVLYNTIIHLDSIFFEAYNTCNLNLDKYGQFFSDDLEFYHDQGGLITSKQEIISATQKNVCGKVTRELIKGSIEVYPIKDFGAVEIGFHTFHNNEEPRGTPSKAGRFLIVWENKNQTWKISRVVSLH